MEWINSQPLSAGLQVLVLLVAWWLKRDVGKVKIELNHRLKEWKEEAERLKAAAVQIALETGRSEAAVTAAKLLVTATEAAEIIKTTAAMEARKIVALAVEEAERLKAKKGD